LAAAGITDVAIVTGYCADRFAELDKPCIYNADHATTNMVASFFCAKERFTRDIIVSYGDIIYNPAIVTNLIRTPGDIVVTIDVGWYSLWKERMDDVLSDAETLVLDGSGAIYSLGERARTIEEIAGQYIGLIKFSHGALLTLGELWDGLDTEFVFRGRKKHQLYFTDLIQLAIDAGHRVEVLQINGGWMEFDTPSDLLLADRTGRVEFPHEAQQR
jgi:choline kinase